MSEYILPGHRKFYSEELVDVTNGADNTYYYYVDCTEKDSINFEGSLGCGIGTVTLTIEGTLQDDGTAAASCTYTDVTNALYGVANVQAAAATQAFQLIDDAEKSGNFRYIRCKVVANTGGAGATLGDWLIRTLCIAR